MKQINRVLAILIIATLVFIGSCATDRKAVTVAEPIKKYDAAAFDYIYVEALKQKLLGSGGDALKYLEQCIKLNPQSDASYYQMAQIVLASGDLTNGKKYAIKAYTIDDKNIWYIMMLSGIYYQEGNIDSAIFVYEKAVQYYPEKINFQVTLADLYSERKEYEKAIRIFEILEEKYGINETTTYAYIQVLMEAERYDDARKKNEELIREYPSGIKYYAMLAEIYRKKGDGGKAREVYQKLMEENPKNGQIQLSLCDFLINEKKYEDLFMMLNPVILNMEIAREDKISLFAKLIGAKDLKKEDIDKILISLMIFETSYSNDDIVPLLRPEFLDNIERDKEAAARLEEIVATRPDNYFAWEKLLLLYLQMQDFNKLMIKGEECASRFNRSFLAKLLYANGAIENGKYEIALDELRKAQILAGDNSKNIVQVLTMRADVYYRMKNYDKSFETFEEAIGIDSEDLTILNNYAYYLAEQNTKLKEAEIMAQKVIEQEIDNATFLDTYAWVLYKRGKSRDAAKIMESIITNDSNLSAEYYEHYGFILKSMKKCDKAIEYWSIAFKIDSTKNGLKGEIENCRR
jgi:tetratricopeptide (TPR) repeat protein